MVREGTSWNVDPLTTQSTQPLEEACTHEPGAMTLRFLSAAYLSPSTANNWLVLAAPARLLCVASSASGLASGPLQSITWHMQRGQWQTRRSDRRRRRPTKSFNLSTFAISLKKHVSQLFFLHVLSKKIKEKIRENNEIKQIKCFLFNLLGFATMG